MLEMAGVHIGFFLKGCPFSTQSQVPSTLFLGKFGKCSKSQHPFPHLFGSLAALTHSQIHSIHLAGQRASSSPFSSVSAALSPGPRLGTYVESLGNHWEEIKEYDMVGS